MGFRTLALACVVYLLSHASSLYASPMQIPPATNIPIEILADSFGAIPNDTIDDTEALQAAFDSLASWACQIGDTVYHDTDYVSACERKVNVIHAHALFKLRLRSGIYLISKPLKIDFFNLRIEGSGAILRPTHDFHADSCPPAVLIFYSSGEWIGRHGRNLRGRANWAIVRDLSVVASEVDSETTATISPARIGIWIGYTEVDTFDDRDDAPARCIPRTKRNAFLKFENVTIYMFPKGVQLGNHTWRIEFEKCHFHSNIYAVFATDSIVAGQTSHLNFGENNYFDRCLFTATRLWLNTGGVCFIASSFLNSTIDVSGDAIVSIVQSHLENPGAEPPGGYFVRLLRGLGYRNTKSAFLTIDQCRFVVSKIHPEASSYPDQNLHFPIFYVDSVTAGLILRDSYFFRNDTYQPQDSGGLRVLVAGPGPVVASGIRNDNAWGGRYVIGKSLNVLLNGDAEQGLKYWQAHRAQATRDLVYRGKRSFVLYPHGFLRQRVPVRPHQVVWSHLVYRTQGQGRLKLAFTYLRPGTTDTLVSTVQYTPGEQDHWFIYVPITHRVPPGASEMEISLQFEGSGLSQLFVDEIIVNLTD